MSAAQIQTSNAALCAAPLPVYTTTAVAHKLSPSQVATWLDCSARWYFHHALGMPEPRTAALLVGEAFHSAIAANFKQKIETRIDAGADAVTTIFDQAWRFGEEQTNFAEEENPAELAALGRELCKVYLRDAAPFIQPAAVELAVHGVIGGVAVGGFVDVIDLEGRIVDLKTAGKKPSGISPSHSLQLTTYAMLADQTLGGSHTQTRIDTVTKTKKPALEIQSVPINEARRKYAETIYPLAQEGMRDGLAVPHRNSFLCSRKNCAHWQACEAEFGGEVKE